MSPEVPRRCWYCCCCGLQTGRQPFKQGQRLEPVTVDDAPNYETTGRGSSLQFFFSRHCSCIRVETGRESSLKGCHAEGCSELPSLRGPLPRKAATRKRQSNKDVLHHKRIDSHRRERHLRVKSALQIRGKRPTIVRQIMSTRRNIRILTSRRECLTVSPTLAGLPPAVMAKISSLRTGTAIRVLVHSVLRKR